MESGDQVEKGDVLAVADEASVTGAIESVQEEIEELDEKISKTQSGISDSGSHSEGGRQSEEDLWCSGGGCHRLHGLRGGIDATVH